MEVDQPGFSRPLDNTIEIRSPEYAEQSEAFGDITRSPQSPDWRQDNSRSPSYSPDGISGPDPFQPVRDSPLSPSYPDNGEYFESGGVWDDPQEEGRPRRHQITLSPPAANSPHSFNALQAGDRREPSPEPGPSHRWPHHQHKSRDPRKKPRKRDAHAAFSEGFHNAIYPRVRRSPSLSPRRELSCTSPRSPAQHPFSPRGDSNEAAMGSRPGSPQASPPRQPYSPILFVRSPERRDGAHSSPLYAAPLSPDVIDIDLEEMEHPQEARDEGVEDEEEEEENIVIEDFDSHEDQGDKDNRSVE